MRLVVIDYGAGNLRSVSKALAHLGVEPTVTDSPRDLAGADAAVLPGVGAAGDAMRALTSRGLVQPIRDYVASGRPFFGVCLGMQVLFSLSEEGGEQPCLDIVPGRVRLLPAGLKVPQMGWNQAAPARPAPALSQHSRWRPLLLRPLVLLRPERPQFGHWHDRLRARVLLRAGRGNLVATQFHPEKSSQHGLQLYRNFLVSAQPLSD